MHFFESQSKFLQVYSSPPLIDVLFLPVQDLPCLTIYAHSSLHSLWLYLPILIFFIARFGLNQCFPASVVSAKPKIVFEAEINLLTESSFFPSLFRNRILICCDCTARLSILHDNYLNWEVSDFHVAVWWKWSRNSETNCPRYISFVWYKAREYTLLFYVRKAI